MMKIVQLILAFLFPPLAVGDRGIKKIAIVTICWIFWWLPGVIAALVILLRSEW